MTATTEQERNARRVEKRLEIAGRRTTPTEEAIRDAALTDFIEQLQAQVSFWRGIAYISLTITVAMAIGVTILKHFSH